MTEERTTFRVVPCGMGDGRCKVLQIDRPYGGVVSLHEEDVAALVLFLQNCGVPWKVSAPASAATASPS